MKTILFVCACVCVHVCVYVCVHVYVIRKMLSYDLIISPKCRILTKQIKKDGGAELRRVSVEEEVVKYDLSVLYACMYDSITLNPIGMYNKGVKFWEK